MRHAIALVVVLLLVATDAALAAGNGGPPCRTVSWVATGNMTTLRSIHAATLLPSGKVLVAGGFPSESTAELYDPATGTWSATGSMSIGRTFHTMTLLPTGKVLVAGGTSSQLFRGAELYDPDTGQWTRTGEMLIARQAHTATLLPTGKVLVVGGYIGGVPSASAPELYDPATGTWTPAAPMLVARVDHTATLLASGQVLVAGGLAGERPTNSAELYDPATGTWTPAAPMLDARARHTATLLRSDAVLVAGGTDSPVFSVSPSPSMEAEVYDPAARTWSQTGSMFAGHVQYTATLLPWGKVLVVGGIGGFGVSLGLANTELFDPVSETWTDAACTNNGRINHTATLLRSGAVLVVGGSGDSSASAELYGIIVSPAQVSLAPGANQTFTAKGGSGLGYVWSFVHNESGGTLTASGVYQAGQVGGVTDILQVVDSYANSGTATVNVSRQATAVSATGSQAASTGCAAARGAALPSLASAVLALLGWRSLCGRRRQCPRTRS